MSLVSNPIFFSIFCSVTWAAQEKMITYNPNLIGAVFFIKDFHWSISCKQCFCINESKHFPLRIIDSLARLIPLSTLYLHQWSYPGLFELVALVIEWDYFLNWAILNHIQKKLSRIDFFLCWFFFFSIQVTQDANYGPVLSPIKAQKQRLHDVF